MLLFDHGLPPKADQIPDADMDVEYRSSTTFSRSSRRLARRLRDGASQYSSDYPAQIGDRMCCTDSYPFRNYCPSISIRENRRISEIGRGSNPNWHRSSDVFETYSDADFRLGYNALQMVVGTVGDLTRATL